MSEELPHVVADVGGTNARFALVAPGTTAVARVQILRVGDFAHITDAFKHFLQQEGLSHPTKACVALAGPVDEDQVRLTNGSWQFSAEQTRQDLGLETLLMVNDFKAQAAAIPYLEGDDLIKLGGGVADDDRFKVVLGPGTGLGVAATIKLENTHLIVQGEGGHIGLSPTTDREIAVHRSLLQLYGRVSAERIICGSGLRNLYKTLREIDGLPDISRSEPEIVADAIAEGDPLCRETLDIFLAYLGAVAGDQALTFGARGGVYIAGGIIPRVKDYIDQSDFRTRFEAKGRLAHVVRDIPTYLVMSRHSGLIGAAACLKEVVS